MPADHVQRPPFMVTLGLMPPYMPADIEKAYLARVKEIRPDLGGDPKPFYELQNAYAQAKEYIKFRVDRRGWIAKRMDEYLAVQEVIDGLKKFGAEVETDALDWLQKSFGDFAELTERILAVSYRNKPNGDAFIEYLVGHHEQLMQLRRIDLTGCSVANSSIVQLGVFRRLQELNLDRTPITADALHVIEWFPELEKLNIDGIKLGWLARRRLEKQLRHKRDFAAKLRAVHPTVVR